MGKAINCILYDDLYQKIIKKKAQMQKNTITNITLTDAVIEVLEDGLDIER